MHVQFLHMKSCMRVCLCVRVRDDIRPSYLMARVWSPLVPSLCVFWENTSSASISFIVSLITEENTLCKGLPSTHAHILYGHGFIARYADMWAVKYAHAHERYSRRFANFYNKDIETCFFLKISVLSVKGRWSRPVMFSGIFIVRQPGTTQIRRKRSPSFHAFFLSKIY